MDLRSRAVEAYNNREGSLEAIASQFRIGTASLKRWLRLLRTSGTLFAKPYNGGPDPKILDTDLQRLKDIVDEKSDRTISELRQVWLERTGVVVGHSTMVRALQRANLTFKKRLSGPPNAT